MAADDTPALPEHVDVAIVGAGFGGLGMAIRLKESGQEDFIVLEREPEVGGTWWANRYPGCQCDVPSNLYSFSFAPKPDWTRSYPTQDELLAYLRECADRFGVRPRIRLRCEFRDARWEPEQERWRIETSDGSFTARVLVTAPGLLSEPAIPELPGQDRFAGRAFHTAAWDHDYDFEGKRVGLIGTGATAIQVGPSIQPRVARLTVFQRTPPWIFLHMDRPIGPRLRSLYARRPLVQRAARAGVYVLRETLVPGMALDPRLARGNELLSRAQRRVQLRDPELRRRVEPTYAVGCKRILPTNRWYPMLGKPNVELVTAGIAELTEAGIRDADGREHELDAIVYATGFSPTDPPIARRLRDAEGTSLSEHWDGSPQAYLSTTVAGFPNLFLLYGPNSNLGHSSIVFMLESQIAYVLDALRRMRSRGAASAEVRRPVQEAYNEEIQERLRRSVWNTGGCTSWYFDRPQLDPVARLHLRVPPPPGALQPGRLRARVAGQGRARPRR